MKITQDVQSDTVHFEVSNEESLQKVQVKTYLTGEVSENDRQALSLKDMENLIPFAAAGLVLLAGLVIGLFIYRDSRKRSGGHR